MMFSRFSYPSFKAIGWRMKQSIPKFIVVATIILITWRFYQWMLAVIFLTYFLYGFFRPFISPKRRREIEEELGEEEPEGEVESA
jgi:CDP-diacylglycerol--serine O-phosphatidyltransferase